MKAQEIIRKYKVSFTRVEYLLEFVAGRLATIEIKGTADESDAVLFYGKLYGEELDVITRLKTMHQVVVKQVIISTSKQKIALWKAIYKIHFGESYKGYFSENKIKNVDFTQELITSFFNSTEWYAKTNNINQYASHYNDIKQKYFAQNIKEQQINTGGAGGTGSV